ncbi:site-specific integrase [Dysgonomonas sp. 216]|uniref:site-specific integrase n=1 Tax=Dysgonomonas sp. 216 TaxID=2302934 RepID=UPI0013D7E8E4|nr:site-specific integrase [Dysgonomonas sp. 216]NDW18277.1 site-specific integrase [Dysgonomonas sp. 216]NDW18645.1 site-specific integrase [Dysgonomonas sp. 216]
MVNILCYKSKTLANGEHPLVIRICKDGKKKYKSLGISVNPKFWDFEKERPKANCPNRELILKIILEKENEYQKQILEFKSEDKDFTASTLLDAKTNKIIYKTVSEFYIEYIDYLKSIGKIGTAKNYRDSFNSLKRFTNNKLDIYFNEITLQWLNKYEKWLRDSQCKETSISVFFRTLRSVFNKAIANKNAKAESYPFKEFKISKFDTTTEKRAIPKESNKQIMNVDLDSNNKYMQLSKDLYVFSYLCGGINFTDIANLQHSNISEGKLSYIRQKTGKKITIPIGTEAIQIVNSYLKEGVCSDDYIFPILDKTIHITELQKYNRKHKVLEHINKCLKIISAKAGINANLTTYVARHSFASVLKCSGVNIALISETLGHSDLKTTQIYLDSFENSQIDEAMKNLL